MMKIFGWNVSFYFDVSEWGLPFGFEFSKVPNYIEVSFSFLCFGVTFERG